MLEVMREKSDSEASYFDYLLKTYAQRPESYYRHLVKVPLRSGARVLDWGCGLGNLLEFVQKEYPGTECRGVDLEPRCVEFIRSRHPDWDIRLLEPPGLRADFPAAGFDRIFLLDVIEHTSEPVLLLQECHRLLKKGGLLTLSTPDRLAFQKKSPGLWRNIPFNLRRLGGREWMDPTHVTEFTRGALERVLGASPFGLRDFRPSFWHRVPWARPPKRHYSFHLDLRK